jgi:hypothetical protein
VAVVGLALLAVCGGGADRRADSATGVVTDSPAGVAATIDDA